MLYNEEAVRANVRNREGKRVFFLGRGDTLTSGARDYLTRERIEILPAEQAPIREYQLPGGGTLGKKPEHMTHLHGNVLVRKTHPRILFRGKLDSLEAELLLCWLEVPEKQEALQEILVLVRHLMRCDVMEEPVQMPKLMGLTEEEIHHRSHFPQDSYGQPHFIPDCADGKQILLLNRLRTLARETELAAVDAFSDRDGVITRPDMVKTLNRVSSMLYILMIEMKQRRASG